MAVHYHGNQIQHEFAPTRLRNWEVSCTETRRPKVRTGRTTIISNDSGHLLPGVPVPTHIGAGPFGHFVPTWHMPKRITQAIIPELQCPRLLEKQKKLELSKSKSKTKSKKGEPKEKSAESNKETDVQGDNDIHLNERPPADEDPCATLQDRAIKEENAEDDFDQPPQEPNNEYQYENNIKDLSYTPGDLTDPSFRAYNYEVLHPKKELTLDDIRKADMMDRQSRESAEHAHKRSQKLNPFACVYRNFALAKKCAKENLEHHPLPDTVTNQMFKKLQMQRALAPGLALDDDIQATGLGWKGYGAKGPTQCTKLRVYRPKTCAGKKLKNLDCRPGSCASFDMKWRYIKQKHVTPIELAICWDMTPEDPTDEPKRTTHIDGSNGSAAPAVFQMVHSPKQPDLSSSRSPSCDGIHGCGTIKSNSAGSHRSRSSSSRHEEHRPQTSIPIIKHEVLKNIDANNNLRSRSISTNSLYVNAPFTRKMSKETNKSFAELIESKMKEDEKLYKSSPNLSINSCANSCCNKINPNGTNDHMRKHKCLACNQPNIMKVEKAKSEYKMAFKAGKVQESKSSDCSSGSGTKGSLKIPKQKDPYAKRNYDINSLHPPFSIWKGTSCQSYPEHWRLASIYQHSYKPPENRKKPLLSSVFQ